MNFRAGALEGMVVCWTCAFHLGGVLLFLLSSGLHLFGWYFTSLPHEQIVLAYCVLTHKHWPSFEGFVLWGGCNRIGTNSQLAESLVLINLKQSASKL